VYQDLSKFHTPPTFRGRNPIIVQLWWLVDALLFKPSPQIMYGWRRMLLRAFGAKIGKNVIIRPSATITYPWKVTIGDYSWIGDNAELYSLGNIYIGSNVVVSQKCYLCTGTHDYQKPTFDIYAQPIIIEDQSWLATDVFVGPSVTIGKGALVGARSTVLKNIEGGYIYAGNPLKQIKQRVTVPSSC
jgi:putative colanic acid biosynthesis acetyltransferase WcaF